VILIKTSFVTFEKWTIFLDANSKNCCANKGKLFRVQPFHQSVNIIIVQKLKKQKKLTSTIKRVRKTRRLPIKINRWNRK
jgi:hypothetical protein